MRQLSFAGLLFVLAGCSAGTDDAIGTSQSALTTCDSVGDACCGAPDEYYCGGGDLVCSTQDAGAGAKCQHPDRVISEAARSIRVIIWNRTDLGLWKRSQQAKSGTWKREPQRLIPPHRYQEFASESDGFMTGTEANVTYEVGDGTHDKLVGFNWSNPFKGDNSVGESGAPGYVVEHVPILAADQLIVFYVVRPSTMASDMCNYLWLRNELSASAEEALTVWKTAPGAVTTPLFKDNGTHGWNATGCRAQGVAAPVRDAQHSTDGFYTIDARLDSMTVGDRRSSTPTRVLPLCLSVPDDARFIRFEVEPGRPAHDYEAVNPITYRSRISYSGEVLVDTDDDDFLEVHPDTIHIDTMFDDGSANPPACESGSYAETTRGDWSDKTAWSDNAMGGGGYQNKCSNGYVWPTCKPLLEPPDMMDNGF